MSRSTLSERAQRLNAAFHLLADGRSLNEAVEAMAEQHGISRRQAYRYLQEAQHLSSPVVVAEPTIPITLKVPAAVAVTLRAYAQANDLTMGETLTRAVCALLATAGGRG
ncbi:hypothetical protein R20943_07057 [Paraburkholderia aspalathi]|nr:hypothetical protein R20943_07055 [Paraburkholderia aspalathi]CAE6839998.1 hypothetical protein R20943_07057 [Paraburkholderia aspalathi]